MTLFGKHLSSPLFALMLRREVRPLARLSTQNVSYLLGSTLEAYREVAHGVPRLWLTLR